MPTKPLPRLALHRAKLLLTGREVVELEHALLHPHGTSRWPHPQCNGASCLPSPCCRRACWRPSSRCSSWRCCAASAATCSPAMCSMGETFCAARSCRRPLRSSASASKVCRSARRGHQRYNVPGPAAGLRADRGTEIAFRLGIELLLSLRGQELVCIRPSGVTTMSKRPCGGWGDHAEAAGGLPTLGLLCSRTVSSSSAWQARSFCTKRPSCLIRRPTSGRGGIKAPWAAAKRPSRGHQRTTSGRGGGLAPPNAASSRYSR
jgi:hypothetical protein